MSQLRRNVEAGSTIHRDDSIMATYAREGDLEAPVAARNPLRDDPPGGTSIELAREPSRRARRRTSAHWLEAPAPSAAALGSARVLDIFSPSGDKSDTFMPASKSLSDLVDPGRLRTWLILYCGGSQPVVDALTRVSNASGIKLKVEKFDW